MNKKWCAMRYVGTCVTTKLWYKKLLEAFAVIRSLKKWYDRNLHIIFLIIMR